MISNKMTQTALSLLYLAYLTQPMHDPGTAIGEKGKKFDTRKKKTKKTIIHFRAIDFCLGKTATEHTVVKTSYDFLQRMVS